MQARRRKRTRPTLFGRGRDSRRGGTDGDAVCGSCLFMMDVRKLLLIIGVGWNAPSLE
jgi:hypothetical protein